MTGPSLKVFCLLLSGSYSICLVTVLQETGMVEPETLVSIEIPAGLVHAQAACKGSNCERDKLIVAKQPGLY